MLQKKSENLKTEKMVQYGPNIKIDSRVIFKFVSGPGCQTNVDDSVTIYRISIWKRILIFSFYFNFNINVLANIW